MSSGLPKDFPKPEELAKVDLERQPLKSWMDPKVDFEARKARPQMHACTATSEFWALPDS